MKRLPTSSNSGRAAPPRRRAPRRRSSFPRWPRLRWCSARIERRLWTNHLVAGGCDDRRHLSSPPMRFFKALKRLSEDLRGIGDAPVQLDGADPILLRKPVVGALGRSLSNLVELLSSRCLCTANCCLGSEPFHPPPAGPESRQLVTDGKRPNWLGHVLSSKANLAEQPCVEAFSPSFRLAVSTPPS